MSGFTIVPASDRCDTLERGLPSTPKEAVMVVYVTYRVPVEVELEIETGEIMDVHMARATGLVLLRSFLKTNRRN